MIDSSDYDFWSNPLFSMCPYEKSSSCQIMVYFVKMFQVGGVGRNLSSIVVYRYRYDSLQLQHNDVTLIR